jgi:hypothetical protein
MLLGECAEAGVQVVAGTNVCEVRRGEPSQPRFAIVTDTVTYRAPALVVATGGLSISKMGSTGFGYDLARQFDVPIEECRPALVPLVLGEPDQADLCDLTGVSADVFASIGKRRFREKLLITHRGLSGPAILQISSYWKAAESLLIDWAPAQQFLAPLRQANARRDPLTAKAALRSILPARLADRLLAVADPQSWTNQGLDDLERQLHAWPFTPIDTEGYEKAEVTAGGVSTDALSAQTMECRTLPGLYFIGEVVDVTGHLGGFNFQWAWASGAAAGRAI